MSDAWIIVVKGLLCGFAALGFGILFNAPTRTFFSICIGGFVAGLVKYAAISSLFGAGPVSASFFAGLMVGLVAIPLARMRDVPHLIITIPSIIPLVPGIFAYRSMMGLMNLARSTGRDDNILVADTIHNGVIAFFVMMAITFGLLVPLLFARAQFFQRKV